MSKRAIRNYYAEVARIRKFARTWQDVDNICPGAYAQVEPELEAELKAAKQRYRAALREESQESLEGFHTVQSDFYGHIEVVPLGVPATEPEEVAEEVFHEEEFIPYADLGFDCTGQSFTRDKKLFTRRGEWYAYHFISYDV